MTATFVFNGDTGSHHIEVDGVKSRKVAYDKISHLEIQGRFYIGLTGYYEGVLPIEQVLCLSTVEGATTVCIPPLTT